MSLVLQKIFSFLKQYWQYVLIPILLVAAFFFYRHRNTLYLEEIKRINNSHKVELEKVEEARKEERLKHEENVKALNNTLESVKKQYEEATLLLEDKKKKEVEFLINEFGNNPVELARRLAEITSLRVIEIKEK